MANSLKAFNPCNPTSAQLRDMARIITLSRSPSKPVTTFGFALQLRMSKARLISLAEGMQAQGWITLTHEGKRIDRATFRQKYKFTELFPQAFNSPTS
jgi:hypothetical protein